MLRHPVLAPGLRVVERGRGSWQVGMCAERSAVLPRSPAITDLLDALLAREAPPDAPETRSTLAELIDAGLVVEATDPRRSPPGRVAILGDLGPGAGVDPEAFVRAAGLTLRRRPGNTMKEVPADPGDAVLVLSRGELDRDRLDPLMRTGTPHLPIRFVDGTAVLGPLVVPGRTACLRCLDAHRAEEDPAHHAVLRRYVDASSHPRPDGVPDPLDPLLATLLVCWGVHDLAAHLAGRRPASWSATFTVDDQLCGLTATRWLRHPACRCCWAQQPTPGRVGPSGTLD